MQTSGRRPMTRVEFGEPMAFAQSGARLDGFAIGMHSRREGALAPRSNADGDVGGAMICLVGRAATLLAADVQWRTVAPTR